MAGRVAGRITDADRERVRDANRIDQVVAEYVALRSAGGGNLKGLCPFHDEKTPSFQVSPARGYYHCFGCGQGGDVFAFIQAIEHLTFVEAVQRLGERSGIQLALVEGGSSTRVERGTRSRLLAANKAAAEFYAAQLSGAGPTAVRAREFLAERGFDLEAALRFGCGGAADGWDGLVKALTGQGFSLEELIRAGLARQGQRGPIDQFHRRLLWQIRDASGDVVGFGARRLFDDDRLEAKYVNTAETPLYRKSQVLFGLDVAKRDIVRSRQVVVVEGYTDVMAMHLAGVTTAVASCGTAFGAEHITVLRRYLLDAAPSAGTEVIRGEVIYTFDGDAAGQKAALKAFDADQRFAAHTAVAIAPDGMDPCELRQVKGDDAVRALVDGRRPLFAFAITSTLSQHDLDTAEGRVAAMAATVPLVARIKEETLREEYTRQLAGWLGAELGPIRSRVHRQVAEDRRARGSTTGSRPPGGSVAPAQTGPAKGDRAQDRAAAAGDRPVPTGDGTAGAMDAGVPEASGSSSGPGAGELRRPDPRDRSARLERETLKLVMQSPQLVAGGYDQVRLESFTDPAYAAIHAAVESAGGPPTQASAVWVEEVAERLPAGMLRSLVSELAVEHPHRAASIDERYAGGLLANMAERVAAADERSLHQALQRAEATGDRDRVKALHSDLVAVAIYRRALADRARGQT